MAASKEVIVTDVSMPFWSMVVFMIKWSFASIPALVIMAMVWAIVGVFTAGAVGAAGFAGS